MLVKKLMIITHCLGAGGTTTYLLGLTQFLSRKGIKILVVARSGVLSKAFIDAGADVVDVPETFDNTSLVYALWFSHLSKEYTSSIDYVGSNKTSLLENEFNGMWYLLKRVFRKICPRKSGKACATITGTSSLAYVVYSLSRLFSSFQPDLVLTTQLPPTLTSLIARELIGYSFPIYEFVMGIKNRLDVPAPWCARRESMGDKTLAPTEEIQRRLELIRPVQSIIEVGNCIDGNQYKPQSRDLSYFTRLHYGIGRDEFVILHVSSDSDIYQPIVAGVCEAFMAFRSVRRSGFLVVVGPEYFKTQFSSYADRVRIFCDRECMLNLGQLSGSLEDIYNIADVFVGVGRTIREAMLCGIPSIVYGVAGHPGLMNLDSVDAARFFNFAGRGCDRASNPQDLFDEIDKVYAMSAGERLCLGTWARDYVLQTDSYDSLIHKLNIV